MDGNNTNVDIYEFSAKNLQSFTNGAIKSAFRHIREILIILLLAIAVAFATNDYKLIFGNQWVFVKEKAPWVIIFIVAHFFAADLGVFKGKESADYVEANDKYKKACDGVRTDIRSFEAYCKILEGYYHRLRQNFKFAMLGINADFKRSELSWRKRRKVRKIYSLKPNRVDPDILLTKESGNGKEYRLINPSLKAKMNKKHIYSVIKIIIGAYCILSLVFEPGANMWSCFIRNLPNLGTLVSVIITGILSAYSETITYGVDRINEKYTVIKGFEKWKTEVESYELPELPKETC